MTPEQFADQAFNFEMRAGALAKQPDTAENFAATWNMLKWPLIEAAKPFRGRQWPARPKKRKPQVGFFMPTATLLAHSVNLLTFLRGLSQLKPAPIDAIVYTFGPRNPEFEAAYAGFAYRCIDNPKMLTGWQNLAQLAADDGIDAMVFVSVVHGMAFATTMGVAPKHIWWAHKWHGLDLPGLDGYIDACHPFTDGPVVIGDRAWRSTYTALPDLFDATKTAQAKGIRDACNATTVFGWMGRAEKLTDHYAHAVAQILQACPEAIYVYAGREDTPGFVADLQAAGVGNRIQHIGWVDTRLWAQVIDVYLDTWPFQSGHTAYEAMAAGKPVVWLHDEKTATEQSASGLVKATWNEGARDLFSAAPWNHSISDYIAMATFLGQDRARTAGLGRGWRAFIDRFMRDEKRMARSVSAAIREAIGA